MGTRILHFADVHAEEKNSEEIQRCLDFMVKTAEQKRPDVIICSGDVTNSQYLAADTKSAKMISSVFRKLSDIAPVAVVCGTFSHDGQTPELLKYVSGKNPIHVSTKPEQIYLRSQLVNKIVPAHHVYSWVTAEDMEAVMIPNQEIVMIVTQIPPPTKENWKNRQGAEIDNQNIAQAMGSIFASFGVMANGYDSIHVLNGHFSMKGSKISETQTLPGTDIAIDTETLSMALADICLLGHIHYAQEYALPAGKKAFHAGSIFRKDFGEQGMAKGFYVHDICDDNEPDLHEFIQTPTREMIQVDYNCVSDPDLIKENFIQRVVSDILDNGGQEKPGYWAKVKITLWIDDIRRINQSALKQSIKEAGADNVVLEIKRVRRENSREEEIIKAETLIDKVRALANHRSQPVPAGVFEMLENVEAMSPADLVKYCQARLNQDKPAVIVNEIEKEREVA
jgi:DNA repair exonuclease SbcCD nuclease subunit